MTRHDIAVEQTSGLSETAKRLANLVLARIAAGDGTEADVARDLLPLVPTRAAPDIWRIEFGRLLVALQAGGLITRADGELAVTAEGTAAVIDLLPGVKALPVTWTNVRDRHLVALALGLDKGPANRIRMLGKADGLRSIIVINHWDLKIRGIPSASRVRSALAVRALARAFGDQIQDGVDEKSTLPSKASRVLAGQLSQDPRDFGTDTRLVSALAAEALGVKRSDLKSLRLALLRSYFGAGDTPVKVTPKRRRRRPQKRAVAQAALPLPLPSLDKVPAGASVDVDLVRNRKRPTSAGHGLALDLDVDVMTQERPDPVGFAAAVNKTAGVVAEGWAGNRRAFISKVWSAMQQAYASWKLTEIEFKCMLTEAHRTGLVVLANADLKDKRLLREFQDSAVVYKNTVWHYVRVPE
ncbi:MAG: hypothetical protein ACK5JT_19195 [Hyphomicrobiaceae bacterium]